VIENSHEIWKQFNEGQNASSKIGRERWEKDQETLSTKKTPKFTKRAGKKRESITCLDGIMRGYISSTRFAMNGRN
jgi:hypothetical protein